MLLVYLFCDLNGSINHCLTGFQGAPRAWQRFEYVAIAIVVVVSVPAVSICLSLSFSSCPAANPIHIWWSTSVWAAVVIPAGNIRRPSVWLSPGVDIRTHTRSRNRRRRNKTKPSTQSEIVPPFGYVRSVWISIYFPLSAVVYYLHMYAYVYLCACVCQGFVSRFARVVCRGFYTVVSPNQLRVPRAEKKIKQEKRREKGTVKSPFDRTSCTRRRLW